MPGYCVQGTVGHKILSGMRKLDMEGRQVGKPPSLQLGGRQGGLGVAG